MSKVLMLKGLPASGKSTHARKLAQQGWKRINKDDLRAMIDDGKWSKGNEKFILRVRDALIENALSQGHDVVVDDTNLAPKHETVIKELADYWDAEFSVLFFDTDVEECIKRDLKRPVSVGEKVIRDMYDQFLKPEPEVYSPDWRLPMAVICDIDGTLAHMKNRSPYDYSKVGEDDVDVRIAELLDILEEKGHTIIMVSGRDGSCRPDTEAWLTKWEVPYKYLYMREAGDTRNDAIVKRELFDEHIRDKYQVLCVLDDRDRVVKMWREIGLKCLQVAEGNF
jgi:predicted kinase